MSCCSGTPLGPGSVPALHALYFGASSVSDLNFMIPWWAQQAPQLTAALQFSIPTVGGFTATLIRAQLSAAATNATSFTLFRDGVSTGDTVTIAAAGTSATLVLTPNEIFGDTQRMNIRIGVSALQNVFCWVTVLGFRP